MFQSATGLLKGIKSTFWNMLGTSDQSIFEPFIYKATSNSNKEQYWVPGTMPSIKEWISNIIYEDAQDDVLEVVNRDWQDGIVVDRNLLRDTEIPSNVNMWIKGIANLYKDFQDELCEKILEDNSTAFDGTAIISDTRPNLDTGTNTIDNLVTGTLSTAYTTTTFSNDFASAKTALYGFRDKNNRAFNRGARLTVLIPTHLEDIANQILSDRAINIIDAATTDPKSNIYSGQAKVVMNWEQATSNNDWYLINEAAIFPPFLIQDRETVKWNMKDDEEFKYIKYWMTFALGYSVLNPMSIVKVNN